MSSAQGSGNSTIVHNLIAGSLAGCSSMVACHPLDVLRVRLQGDSRSGGLTVTRLLKEIIKHEGAMSLYRGFLPPFFAQGVYKSTIFCTNSLVSQYLFTGKKTPVTIFTSGCIAGSVNAFVVSPVELIRTRLIIVPAGSSSATASGPSLSMWACFRGLLAEPRGFAGLWRGLVPTIARDGPGVGFYLLAFEEAKRFFVEQQAAAAQTIASAPTDPSLSLPSPSPSPLPPLPLYARVTAAACAGIAFWLWALPVDGIKTLVEMAGTTTDSASTYSVLQTLRRNGGSSRILRAWPVALGRGLPSAIVTLTVYDVAMGWLVKPE